MDELTALTWLSLLRGIHGAGKKYLLTRLGSARAVWAASDSQLLACLAEGDLLPRRSKRPFGPDRDVERARDALQQAALMKAFCLPYGGEDYPPLLASLPDAPLLLFGLGRRELLAQEGVAVVGTRRASAYGRWAAQQIARRVAACGVPVVSGLAEGIDGEAHRGCLSQGTGTVAVLGTGLSICFPASHRRLFEQIAREGLLLSEYHPGDRGYPSNFPMRNRIISGLARSLVVVEGAEKSGSMITAGLAAEQGREVFAVPGNINQPHSAGVNRLIYDGAFPLTDLDQVVGDLGLVSLQASRREAALSREEAAIVDLLRKQGPLSKEEIGFMACLEPSVAAALVTALELKGVLMEAGRKMTVAN